MSKDFKTKHTHIESTRISYKTLRKLSCTKEGLVLNASKIERMVTTSLSAMSQTETFKEKAQPGHEVNHIYPSTATVRKYYGRLSTKWKCNKGTYKTHAELFGYFYRIYESQNDN